MTTNFDFQVEPFEGGFRAAGSFGGEGVMTGVQPTEAAAAARVVEMILAVSKAKPAEPKKPERVYTRIEAKLSSLAGSDEHVTVGYRDYNYNDREFYGTISSLDNVKVWMYDVDADHPRSLFLNKITWIEFYGE
jgi:hypothetical protein